MDLRTPFGAIYFLTGTKLDSYEILKKYPLDHPAVLRFVSNLIGLGQMQHEIHDMLKGIFVNALDPDTCDTLIADARVFMLGRLKRPVDEILAESIAFYEGIIRTADRDGDRIKARERIDTLLGLEERIMTGETSEGLAKVARTAWEEMENLVEEPEYDFD